MGSAPIGPLLLSCSVPMMISMLVQALYNIVDSFFVGRYSESGLTALSIIYPIQLLMIALAVGTGVGINTVMAAKLGVGEAKKADEYAGVGTPLAAALWLLFAAVCWAVMPAYARISTSSDAVIRDVTVYGRIVCVFSFGLFLESIWTKVLQSIGEHRSRPAFDLRPFRPSGNGDRRCCRCYCCGADRGGARRDEKGLSPLARGKGVSAPRRKDLPSRHTEYPDAVGVHFLYFRP